MPKVNGYQKRETDIRAWIAYGVIVSGVRTKKELAKRIGMPLSTFQYREAHPGTFKLEEIWRLESILGKFEVER